MFTGAPRTRALKRTSSGGLFRSMRRPSQQRRGWSAYSKPTKSRDDDATAKEYSPPPAQRFWQTSGVQPNPAAAEHARVRRARGRPSAAPRRLPARRQPSWHPRPQRGCSARRSPWRCLLLVRRLHSRGRRSVPALLGSLSHERHAPSGRCFFGSLDTTMRYESSIASRISSSGMAPPQVSVFHPDRPM